MKTFRAELRRLAGGGDLSCHDGNEKVSRSHFGESFPARNRGSVEKLPTAILHPAERQRYGAVIRSCSRFPPTKVMGVLLVTSNKSRQLLCVRYIGRVRPEEFLRNREDLIRATGGVSGGLSFAGRFQPVGIHEPGLRTGIGPDDGIDRNGGRGSGGAGLSRPKQGHRDEHPDGFSLSASSAGGDLSKSDRSRQGPRSLRRHFGAGPGMVS